MDVDRLAVMSVQYSQYSLAVDLNPADWELCRGFAPGSLPRGVGLDVAGRVEAVREGVDAVAVGYLVFGTPPFTARPTADLATFAVLDTFFALPVGLDVARVAALITSVRTATWTLDSMGVHDGTWLLIHGGGSTIGYPAVQRSAR